MVGSSTAVTGHSCKEMEGFAHTMKTEGAEEVKRGAFLGTISRLFMAFTAC